MRTRKVKPMGANTDFVKPKKKLSKRKLRDKLIDANEEIKQLKKKVERLDNYSNRLEDAIVSGNIKYEALIIKTRRSIAKAAYDIYSFGRSVAIPEFAPGGITGDNTTGPVGINSEDIISAQAIDRLRACANNKHEKGAKEVANEKEYYRNRESRPNVLPKQETVSRSPKGPPPPVPPNKTKTKPAPNPRPRANIREVIQVSPKGSKITNYYPIVGVKEFTVNANNEITSITFH